MSLLRTGYVVGNARVGESLRLRSASLTTLLTLCAVWENVSVAENPEDERDSRYTSKVKRTIRLKERLARRFLSVCAVPIMSRKAESKAEFQPHA